MCMEANRGRELHTFAQPIHVDQLVATSIQRPGVLHEAADRLKRNQGITDLLLPETNPLVSYYRDRLKAETAQFGSMGQIIQEAVMNGAEARRSDGEKVC